MISLSDNWGETLTRRATKKGGGAAPGGSTPIGGFNPSGGFTLIELIVVLMIIGVVLAIVPFTLARSLPSAKLKSAAREFSASIRLARATAIRTAVAQAVFVDIDGRSFGIRGRGEKALPEGVGIKVVGPSGRGGRGDRGVEMTRGVWSLVFTPYGGTWGPQAAMGAEVVFYNERGLSVSVVLDPVVGSTVHRTGNRGGPGGGLGTRHEG